MMGSLVGSPRSDHRNSIGNEDELDESFGEGYSFQYGGINTDLKSTLSQYGRQELYGETEFIQY